MLISVPEYLTKEIKATLNLIDTTIGWKCRKFEIVLPRQL